MKIIKESPILRSTAKSGKSKFWQAYAYEEKGEFFYVKKWWQEGSKEQESTPVQVKGLNIGKSNETTDKDQCLSELDSIIRHQRDRGYSEDGSATHMPTKPMLANKYKDKKHLLKWPVFVQPKLDGFRMLKDGDGEAAWTRGGKQHVEECVKHLMWDTGDYTIDGELILPGNQKLQLTAQAAKKYKAGISETLMYHVYDVVIPELPYSKRLPILKKLLQNAPKNVILVPTLQVADEKEMFEQHARFVGQGYEGTIIRTDAAGYEIGFRSNSLLKYKDFQDDEFTVVDVEEGKGSFEGKAILVCDNKHGGQFRVTPEGTMEYREELWKKRKKLVGQLLTVRYQTLSEDGNPIFPIGVDFREKSEA